LHQSLEGTPAPCGVAVTSIINEGLGNRTAALIPVIEPKPKEVAELIYY